jgi:hypothetical protein
MEHLTTELSTESGIHTEIAGAAKRDEWNIEVCDLDCALERTQRLAIALKANPGLINPNLAK